MFKPMKKRMLSVFAVLSLVISGMLVAVPAQASMLGGASADDLVSGDEVVFAVKSPEGDWVAADPQFSLQGLNQAPEVTPYLIDWNQRFGCFSLNNASDEFMRYGFLNDGSIRDIVLYCGDSTYGYKHIRTNHESNWQATYDQGVALGWDPEAQWVEGWDDLMSQAVGISLFSWQYIRDTPASNKRCVLSQVGFLDQQTWHPIIEFKVVAVFATDGDRLITAYPVATSKTSC